MARLRGAGLGAGMAMGTAAVVRTRTGIALAPEIPARLSALVASRRLTETPEVILISEDYRTGAAIAESFGWAKVVGIAVERSEPEAPVLSVPVVTGVEGLMQAVADDVLVLVDATRGVVLVDPDPIYLAQYTAEHDRVAPRNRLYLDDAHQPAHTMDGRAISVSAIVGDGGIEHALSYGPDALYHVLPLTFDPDEIRRHLASVVAVAAGKPLIVPYNASLPLTPLIEVASQTDITIVVSPGQSSPLVQVAALVQEIELAQAECLERDIVCGSPRLAVELGVTAGQEVQSADTAPVVESLAANGITRLICRASIDTDSLRALANLVTAAAVHLLPAAAFLHADGCSDPLAEDGPLALHVRLMIGAGVAGLVVAPELSQITKQIVRETSVDECRDAIGRWLSASA